MPLRPGSKAEVRRGRYKVAVDAEEGRRRREDNMVEIRKNRREESLQKKCRESLQGNQQFAVPQDNSSAEKKASVAKLETSVSLYGDQLELKVFGFNDKLPALLFKILTTAKSFLPKYDRFEVIKEDLERTLKNTNMKPLNHASYLRLQVLCQSFWDAEEKLCLLNDLSLSDLRAFIPDLLSQVRSLCHFQWLAALSFLWVLTIPWRITIIQWQRVWIQTRKAVLAL